LGYIQRPCLKKHYKTKQNLKNRWEKRSLSVPTHLHSSKATTTRNNGWILVFFFADIVLHLAFFFFLIL
jgi:hypothetical protein